MIKSITLKNIESHEDTVIRLGWCNAFTGPTDSGKSAVMRALESFLYFRGLNLRFDETTGVFVLHTDKGILGRQREDEVTWVCSECEDRMGEETEVCRCGSTEKKIKRKKVLDHYKINGQTFEKMGRGWKSLDEAIKDFWPVAYFEFSPDKPFFPGFRTQFDRFIWDELSASDLSYLFSHLEGLDYIEDMVKLVRSDITESRKNISFLKPEVKELEEELTKAKEFLADKDSEREIKEASYRKLKSKSTLYFKCEGLWGDLTKTNGKCKVLQGEIDTIKSVDVSALREKVSVYQAFAVTIGKMESLEDEISSAELEFEDHGTSNVTRLSEAIEELESLRQLSVTLGQKFKEIKLLEVELAAVEEELDELNTAIKKRFLDHGLCPFTGWKIAEACARKFEK